MVGERGFSKKQGPQVLQNRSYPGQWPRFINSMVTAIKPMSYAGDGLAEKGRRRLRTVKALRPAAGCGGIGQTIRILELRQRLLPATALHKAPQKCLTACQQAVMRVRKREQRKESKGRTAVGAAAAMDPNPVVMLVVSLLAAAAMTNNRISFTNRALA
jgi:hypothetical protein